MSNLKKIRISKDISDKEMAFNVGVSMFEYINYEENPMLIPVSIACKIAEVLKCTLNQIFLPDTLQNED